MVWDERREEVHRDTYIKFVNDHFHIELSPSTASRYLNEDEFTSKRLPSKPNNYNFDANKLHSQMWSWITQMRKKGVFNIDPSHLCSLDFTYTSHRNDFVKSFSFRGSQNFIAGEKVSSYTNCIVDLVWLDGENRTPPVLFTYNQQFRVDKHPTERRNNQVKHLKDSRN